MLRNISQIGETADYSLYFQTYITKNLSKSYSYTHVIKCIYKHLIFRGFPSNALLRPSTPPELTEQDITKCSSTPPDTTDLPKYKDKYKDNEAYEDEFPSIFLTAGKALPPHRMKEPLKHFKSPSNPLPDNSKFSTRGANGIQPPKKNGRGKTSPMKSDEKRISTSTQPETTESSDNFDLPVTATDTEMPSTSRSNGTVSASAILLKDNEITPVNV